ncbi:CRISPR-associated helicase Cas3' [Streptomyces sp. MBT67]|uniref:CRISPR-associated helicase Cas3' n=1 Tax=unclassified Streptomyces TaxID=2593676 RepID=UPI00190BA3EA|nr:MULTISPECIES: CRISPR-associated helicase Cas3' [unclassified Streptomyces]MBK3532375.1 CRISPR-associated helicase Cas3' [Streptomyces sp. MBT72]MBK3538124.1 CRISPR-associated helicase Cas3' [Streptomyces sp. MBT67]MBK3551413.1 CRISPR-associated helicase Cas3' [Streptomyces sp. MBT61]MBK6032091.1 CRISPR-associated helicase Cas3' [Streptomyces sp. MBT59]
MLKGGEAGVSGRCFLDVRLWGKENGLSRPYPVVCHLLDTSAAFQELWDEVVGDGTKLAVAGALGLGLSETRSVVSFWAGLHDIGKISPPFQAQVPLLYGPVRDDPTYVSAPGAEGERDFRHECASHWSLYSLLAEVGYPTDERLMHRSVSHQIAQLLGGHHGVFGSALKAKQARRASDYNPGLGSGGWADQRQVHFDGLRRATGAFAVPRGGLPAGLAVVVAGLVVVADWLASQTSVIEPRIPGLEWSGAAAEIGAHWQGARKAAAEVVKAARLGRAEFSTGDFGSMFPFRPNSLQRDLVEHLPAMIDKHGPGLVLVTAPTGDGKTEAALFAASVLGRMAGARGLYFALPTMGTADAMLPRVEAYAAKALSGERALMLLHSMSWLSSPGGGGRADVSEGQRDDGAISAGQETVVEADGWLRGTKRGLLAPLGVGTIDQALGAVLPLRYNVLRLLGLSDKVFVLDEAHAYGPWMHQLLVRLLEWLGEMRAPVVLLSATLTGRTAGSLVDAYRRGAGMREPAGVVPRYPGWLFASAAADVVSPARATESDRVRTLRVSHRSVVWDASESVGAPVLEGGRRAALREVLAPVAAEGGAALVCCTTVAEAQQTYRDVCAAFPELAVTAGGVRLLHSRYPADQRARITAECEAAYGKPGDGPDSVRSASVLVATQVVEQSLDFDFDLVVSDLAPIAQLLQRAGRGRRHRRGPLGRPAWAAAEDEPALVVLDPFTAEASEPPRSWGRVYDAGLLVRTSRVLKERALGGFAVPDDVQRLVDEVYEEDFVDRLEGAAREELVRLDEERLAGEAAERHLAAWTSICSPADVKGDLSKLSAREAGVTQELLTTRLGADTGRVLCLYQHPDGRTTLDPEGMADVPGGGRWGLQPDELAAVARRVAPVPGRWLRSGDPGTAVPGEWGTHPSLRDLVLLRMVPAGEGGWVCRVGRYTISISGVGLEAQ